MNGTDSDLPSVVAFTVTPAGVTTEVHVLDGAVGDRVVQVNATVSHGGDLPEDVVDAIARVTMYLDERARADVARLTHHAEQTLAAMRHRHLELSERVRVPIAAPVP